MKVFRFAALLPLFMFLACLNEIKENEASATSPVISHSPSASDKISIGAQKSTTPYSSKPMQEIKYGANPVTINLGGLSSHSVYLVSVNTSNSEIDWDTTAAVLSYNSETSFNEAEEYPLPAQRNAAGGFDWNTLPDSLSGPVSGIFIGNEGQTIIRYEHQGNDAEVLNAVRSAKLRSKGAADGLLLNESTGPIVTQFYSTGVSSKEFWVQTKNGGYEQIVATLRASGYYSNIWVANSNFTTGGAGSNKISQTEADELAVKFDSIYEYETPVFGFEYGGDVAVGAHAYGGVDGDPKIQILVYDIFNDYSAKQSGGVLGYFYSGDEYKESELQGYNIKTNEAEIFYIDAHFTNIAANAIYSTLAHEFQHMINYNQKTIKSGYKVSAGVWYNEMLSMLAEDVIDPLIGITASMNGHPVTLRIPTFLATDAYIPKSWGNSLSNYANGYAFGAYLARNFGGAALIQKMMTADYLVDEASISAALASDANPLRDSVNNFNTAVSRYGEAMLFNQDSSKRPADVFSFNNTVTNSINNTDYTFEGFDIWAINNSTNSYGGPPVYDAGKSFTLSPNTMLIQSKPAWQNQTGTLSITISPPKTSSAKSYIMVR